MSPKSEQERISKRLSEEGNKLMKDGQEYNIRGDKFTLLTVFFTISLFFAGLSSVMRRFTIKTTFLGIATLMLVYSCYLMMGMKLAS